MEKNEDGELGKIKAHSMEDIFPLYKIIHLGMQTK